jgi:hypothetical protein
LAEIAAYYEIHIPDYACWDVTVSVLSFRSFTHIPGSDVSEYDREAKKGTFTHGLILLIDYVVDSFDHGEPLDIQI